jgi:hypothetical protein
MSGSNAAEIGVIADGIDRYRARVIGLAEPIIGTPNEDLLAALYEAERNLRAAARSMERAHRLAK